jgi:hypothetical protein
MAKTPGDASSNEASGETPIEVRLYAFVRVAEGFVNSARLAVEGDPIVDAIRGLHRFPAKLLSVDTYLAACHVAIFWNELGFSAAWSNEPFLLPLVAGLHWFRAVFTEIASRWGINSHDEGEGIDCRSVFGPLSATLPDSPISVTSDEARALESALSLLPSENDLWDQVSRLKQHEHWHVGTRAELNKLLGKSPTYPNFLEQQEAKGLLKLRRWGDLFAICLKDPSGTGATVSIVRTDQRP